MAEPEKVPNSTKNSPEFIPFAKPVLGPEEEAAVLEVLRSGWLTTGPQTKAFEQEFAAYTGAPYALAVNSATSGLHLALEALGIGPGDTVAVPTYTFTATAEVIRYLGAVPVFVDCGPGSFNMDCAHLKTILEKMHVKAVMAVHLAGESVDWERLLDLQKNYHFKIIEDAAHAFPVPTARGFLGCLGDVGVYSFYANKTMTTGEGGMIVTSDKDLESRMKIMRLHGIDRDAFNRFTSDKPAWAYEVVAPGFKYNMTDLAAAIGRVQLKKAKAFLDQRRDAVKIYQKLLAPIPGLKLPPWNEDHAWHLYLIALEGKDPPRDQVIEDLSADRIGTSVHYIPLHRMPYWRHSFQLHNEDFPRAEDLWKRVISLPLYPGLTPEQQDRIARSLAASLKRRGIP